MSRIDRGAIPVHLESVALKEMLDEVNRVVSIQPAITLDPEDLMVEADLDHLSRVLINLVENAAKYAPESLVEIYGWQRGAQAVIAVVDHRPGIPDHDKERIFDRFTQLDQFGTRAKGGTGLGLSIVQSLSDVMHGSVRIEDTEDGGATFVVEVPIAASIPAETSF